MSKRERNIAISALIGAGVGYLAGILTAPKSGKETRQDIVKFTVKTRREAEAKVKTLHNDLNELIEKAESKFSDAKSSAQIGLGKAIEKARLAKTETREVLSSIHEGDVQDDELRQAISDAQSAAEHLKSFLNKKTEI